MEVILVLMPVLLGVRSEEVMLAVALCCWQRKIVSLAPGLSKPKKLVKVTQAVSESERIDALHRLPPKELGLKGWSFL